MKKVVKTVTTRTVQQVPMGPDGLPLETSPVTSNYVQTMDRNFRKNGNGGPGSYLSQPGTATLPRNYHYPDGYGRPYDDSYPGSDHSYGSLSRVTRIDERYRPSMDAYRAPSRQDIYGPQPQVRVGGSNMDLNHFHPESYGLEDDQRSVGFDDVDYGLMSDYGTARRAGTPSDARRRLRYWGIKCVAPRVGAGGCSFNSFLFRGIIESLRLEKAYKIKSSLDIMRCDIMDYFEHNLSCTALKFFTFSATAYALKSFQCSLQRE